MGWFLKIEEYPSRKKSFLASVDVDGIIQTVIGINISRNLRFKRTLLKKVLYRYNSGDNDFRSMNERSLKA